VKRVFLLWIYILLFIANVSAYAQDNASEGTRYFYDGQWHDYHVPPTYLQVNGEQLELEVPPLIFRDNAVVPARAVFEKMGAAVTWDGKKAQVGIHMKNMEIVLTINDTTAVVNGKKYTMNIPPKIVNSTTMIPVRFVAEKLGMKVGWIENKRLITIDYENTESEKQDISINQIEFSLKDAEMVITIAADREIEHYSYFELNDHPRLVLDINHAVLNTTSSNISLLDQNIYQIRAAQHQINPSITRVVVDLKQWTEYRVEQSENKERIFVYFTLKKENINNIVTEPGNNLLNVTLNPLAKDKLVVIDPGHGGAESGALGRNDNGEIEVQEKDLNLDIALKTAKLLEQAGVKYYMTRTDDSTVGLYDRPAIANQLNAALFVSIHNNAFTDTSVNGTEVLHYPGKDNPEYGISGTRLAELVLEELLRNLGTTNRGLRDGSKMVVINKAKMPSIIAEIAFVTNPKDRANLMNDSFRQKAAEAIATAIIRALNESVQ